MVKDPYAPYRQQALPRPLLKELSHVRPWRVVGDTALAWIAIVAAWTGVALSPAWWTVALAIPVIGTRYYALAILGHDGLHRRLFARVPDNDWFCDLFLIGPIGAITRLHNVNHLSHHQHLAQASDPDRHKYICNDKGTFAHLLGYLMGIRGLSRSVRNVVTGAAAADAGRLRPRPTMRDVVIIAGWQGALVVGLTSMIGWWAYPVLWVLPVGVFTVLADHWRTFCEHSQPEADELADDHRLITYVSSPIERLVMAPHNMNLHAAHHLWPSIPYYNLPQADAALRASRFAPELEWRGSYAAYIWRYFRRLPIEGCDGAQLRSH